MSAPTPFDLRSPEKWQQILDEVQRELGLPTAVTDAANQILATGGERNPLCLGIRERESALPVICGQSQQYMSKMAREGKKPVVETCEAGMAKFVVPLFREGTYAGCFTACGARLPDEEIETFLIGKTTGMDEAAVEELAASVPVVDGTRLRQAAEALFLRLNAPD